jgi:mono/diheme cytochrome c family protein
MTHEVLGMTGVLLVAAALVPAAPVSPGGPGLQAPVDTMVVRGKEVYRRQRCRVCHSIEGEGNRRYPLDGVASRLNDGDLRKWIVAPQEMAPRVRKQAYDKLPEADLAALVAYLKTLKAPASP